MPPGFGLERVLAGQDGPIAVTFDAAGNAILAEEGGGGRILRLTPAGAVDQVAAGGFPLPLGGLSVHDGLIDIAAGGSVLELPEQGGTRKPLAVGLRGPLTGLVLARDGQLLLGVAGTGHVAAMPSAGGPALVAWGGLHVPTGLALGPDGSLYVADDSSGGDRILRLGPAPGAAPVPVATLDSGAAAVGIALPPPGPFASAGADLYVAVAGGVDTVNLATGAVRPFLTTPGPGGLRRPAGIAFSPDGRTLYIADVGDTIANVPLPLTGALWRVVAMDGPLVASPAQDTASPAMQVTPEPGPQNKVRAGTPQAIPWYRQPHVLMYAAGALILLALVVIAQFRRTRL
ncbi:MAG TPA: hypothetical protein VNM16_10900 [Bacillota bacterium]|nr:hypothetical protein [Bacillota bacterium]